MPEFRVVVSYTRSNFPASRMIKLLATDESQAGADAIDLVKIGMPQNVSAKDFNIKLCQKVKRHA